MYVHHPLTTEFFDYDVFQRDNYPLLKNLFSQICDLIPGTWTDRKIVEERASVLTMAVFGNATHFGEVIDLDEDFEEHPLAEQFFQYAVFTCVYLEMEDSGDAQRNAEGEWGLTPQGEKTMTKLAKAGRGTGLFELLQKSRRR